MSAKTTKQREWHLQRLNSLIQSQENEVREALQPSEKIIAKRDQPFTEVEEQKERLNGAEQAKETPRAEGEEIVATSKARPEPTAVSLERRLIEVLDPFVSNDPSELRILVRRLGLPRHLPANTMMVDDDAWQRLMSMRTRTGLTMTSIASYVLSVVIPKPTSDFAAQWMPRYDDLKAWLDPVLKQGRAVATHWQRPAWLEAGEEIPTGIRHPVRYIEHPYIALRLAELEAHTGLRSLCLTLAVKRFFPPSTVQHQPKRRQH